MDFTVTLAFIKDVKKVKTENVRADGAVKAMQIAEMNNPEWISVSAELQKAA